MHNFSIGIQVNKELTEFRNSKVRLANMQQDEGLRFLNSQESGYFFNQADAISIIDLYYNSKFESGTTDKQGQRKLFMNVGKFRSEVASKQIDLDVKDFKFTPTDYADPWTAIFLGKGFKEWAKDNTFGELVNTCVDNLPKYGSVVLKEVKQAGGKILKHVPLQNLVNEQTAECLDEANYVIEIHPDMHIWDMQAMKSWDMDGLQMDYADTGTVYERYGYVPLAWLKKQNKQAYEDQDWMIFKKALVIMMFVNNSKDSKAKQGAHIFFAAEIKKLPYREAHWTRQHGRWLGCGVMEDLVENQQAKNIIVNLIRRSLHWSSKRVLQSSTADVIGKNLVKDVADGEILEVGINGLISQVDLQAKSQGEFQQFLNEWEHNSDQKAFTYEVATGEGLPGGTPFRLGVVLSNAVNSYFKKKQEQLGLFLKKSILDFLIPQFLADMKDKDKTLSMFSGESGYEVLKAAAMDLVKLQACHASLLSGKPIDQMALENIIQPFQSLEILTFNNINYDLAKAQFDLDVTGEDVDIPAKVETLKSLYTLLSQAGDPRAEKVLNRISELAGETMSQFGVPSTGRPQLPGGAAPASPGAMPQLNTSNAKVPATA